MSNLNQYNQPSEDALCRQVKALLPEYIESTLATRQAWDVEKHLTICGACAQVSREMQATVTLLQSSRRFETGDDFMAKLHARLDGLEPEPIRARSWKIVLQDWLADMRQPLQIRRLPALGMGAAMAALAVFAITRPPIPPVGTPTVSPSAPSVNAQQQHVALTASNPFDDPVAAHLQAQGSEGDTGSTSELQ